MLQPDRLGFNPNFLAVKHANRRHTIDLGLITASRRFKKCQYIGIQSQRDLLLIRYRRQCTGTGPLHPDLRRDIAEIDILVSQRFQACLSRLTQRRKLLRI